MDEKELKELLTKESEEFRKVCELHQKYEKELEKISKKGFLTEDEKLGEKELKKKKLILKDKMYIMMTEFRKTL